MKFYTLGHSNREFDEFCEILREFGIALVIDVRRFPQSQKFPHFNRENLEGELSECGINYMYLGDLLGGYREGGYEEYMKTDEFNLGLGKLLFWGIDGKTVILCAEKLWFKCHRRFIADRLVELGHEVVHIIDKDKIQKHTLSQPEIGLFEPSDERGEEGQE